MRVGLGLHLTQAVRVSAAAPAGIVKEVATSASANDAQSVSVQIVVPNVPNRILVIFGFLKDTGNGSSITGASVNGAAVTDRGNAWGLQTMASAFTQTNPAVGTRTVEVSSDMAAHLMVIAAVFSGVHQTTPVPHIASDSATGTTASVNVTAATDSLVVDGCIADTAVSLTRGAGQSQVWGPGNFGVDPADARAGSSSEPGPGSPVVMSWALGGSVEWSLAALELKAA